MKIIKLILPTLILCTPLSALANEEGKNGFAILGGFSHIGGDAGDSIDECDGTQNLLTISGSYTWKSGFGLGLTSSTMADSGFESDIGHANIYAAYTMDSNIKLMAGVGALVEEDDYGTFTEAGPMLGLGYTFPVGVSVELHHTFQDSSEINYTMTSLLIGYKW